MQIEACTENLLPWCASIAIAVAIFHHRALKFNAGSGVAGCVFISHHNSEIDAPKHCQGTATHLTVVSLELLVVTWWVQDKRDHLLVMIWCPKNLMIGDRSLELLVVTWCRMRSANCRRHLLNRGCGRATQSHRSMGNRLPRQKRASKGCSTCRSCWSRAR